MGCGASAAQIPAAPPAGSGLAAIKHQKSAERKADLKSLEKKAGDAEERRPSVSSDASTNTSGDNASCDNISDSSAQQIFEEVAAAATTASDDDLKDGKTTDASTKHLQTVADFAAAATNASEQDLKNFFLNVPQMEKKRISEAVAPLVLADYATAATSMSNSDLKKSFEGIPGDIKHRMSQALCSLNTPATAAVASSEKSVDVEVTDAFATHPLNLAELAKVAGNASNSDLKDFFRGVNHTQQKKLAASIAPIVLGDYAAAASTIQDSDLKATLDKLPEELRQKLSQALCSAQASTKPALEDYAAAASTIQDSDLKATLDKLSGDSIQKISQALCNIQASARLVEVTSAKDATVKDTDASATPVVSTPAKNADLNATEVSTTRPLTLAEIVEIAANSSEEELRDFFKDVPEMDQKRISGTCAPLLLADYAAAANAMTENDLKTLLHGLPGEMRQKISQALPKI